MVVELAEPMSSRTAHRGGAFALRLTNDLVLGGRVVLPAGTPGWGEVIDAAAAGLAGRPGMLILAARSLESGNLRLTLRGFRVAGNGRDDSKTIALLSATPYVGLLALGVQGGNIDYPAGTRGVARVAAAVSVAPPPLASDGKPLRDTPPQPPTPEGKP